jgi:uncharacterized repeat protein (TIGR01451 family)
VPVASNTPVPPASADLQITKTDNATDYAPGITVRYIIVASNAGPSSVTGATVTDTFPADLDPLSIAWTCSGSGGASCTAAGSGNITDSAVNLPVGTSVTYTVNATVIGSPAGPALNNIATIAVPVGVTDPNPGNNSASDTPSDQLISANSFPYGAINAIPNCPAPSCAENIPAGTFLVLQLSTPLVVISPDVDGYDLVYYPDPVAPTLQMDVVILQVGDGSNWYTILYWGNGVQDANTDLPPNAPGCTSESDNCVVDVSSSINSPGVSIQLDGVVPSGTYPYIRIISLPDSGDGVDIDAITVLP